jgi:anti-anti-sigma factor
MSNAEIKSRMVEGAAIIYPGPYLNQLRGEDIENCCQEFLKKGVNRLVINFRETELINSIGISILLGVIEAVNDAEGCLVLSNLSATNRELFEMLGLLGHVRIEDSEQSALDALAEKAGTAVR